jgi:gliding motility-associated-like protein
MKLRLRFTVLVLLLLTTLVSYATHIRAIEITAKRISSANLTFKFTVTGYRDVNGVNFSNGRFSFGDGTFFPAQAGDNIPWQSAGFVGNDTEKVIFTITHTYSGAGAYKVSYQESFRNDGIVNMSNSVGTDYFSETLVIIDPLVGINNTPILTIPPIDIAACGLVFIHNPGAFDEDGDSLSYRFSVPLQAKNLQVTGYRSLINPAFYPDGFNTGNEAGDGPPTLTLDPVTGDLIWDAPGEPGEYNVAFIVEEWRKINGIYFRLGYVTRDMQILVECTDNNPPEVTIPEDLCVAAGTFIDDTVYEPDIIGTDPDGHRVTISAFGGPFEVSLPATFSPSPPVPQNIPGVMEFLWQTDCQHIRERPYEVRIKIEDNPPNNPTTGQTVPKLVDFETWNITVVGPAPTGLMATPVSGRRMRLDWDAYACPNTGGTMQVWRRVGPYDFTPENCELGIPENSDYELVVTLPIDADVYIDNNNGLGLAPGANYCYRLVAQFPDPTGGTSYASDEICQEMESIAPMITKVDVTSTDEANGTIRVEWIDPLDINTGPYTYDVLRATGKVNTKSSFVPVATGLTDTFFDDSGLNTKDNAYSYMIKLYDNSMLPIDSSFAASSVRLELVPQVGAMKVNWSALVPWSNSNSDYPLHDIYRDQVNPGDPSELVMIATVDVTQNGFTYLDDGSHNGIPLDEEVLYCYSVFARGSYDNSDPLVPEPILNNSQIQCAQPNDEVPPCTPINFTFDEALSCENQLPLLVCGSEVYQNRLLWEEDMSPECDEDVVSYNLYFSATGAENSYTLLVNTTNVSYTHNGLSSLKGCYIIAAVDRSGNESTLSDPICQENCIFDGNGDLIYVLPNVFTPNGDGLNDTFRAFGDNDPSKCPRFVLNVEFLVIDRTGKKLYTYSSGGENGNIYIDWDGRNNNGKELATGTYYYSAVVTFDTLDPKLSVQKLNGWVQILR